MSIESPTGKCKAISCGQLPYFRIVENFSLSAKIKLAQDFIKKAYNANNGKIFISYSGGKDSTILRDIALKIYPDLKVVFSNTTNELLEVLQYVKNTPDVVTVLPKMSFKEVVKTHGFPLISKETSQKVNELKHTNGKKTRLLRYYGNSSGNSKLSMKWRFLAEQEFDVTHKCCAILKKNPLNDWAKEHGLKPIIALMKDESRLRKQLALYGKDDGKKIYPFLNTGWTESDIWEYSRLNNIRFAECYYDRRLNNVFIPKRDRTGCEYCMFGVDQEKEDRFARSKILTPKRYKNMMNLKNNGVTFAEAKRIAQNENNISFLGLYGGVVENVRIKDNVEIYDFKIISDVIECACCSKKGSKTAKKNTGYISSFIDTPNPLTGKNRVVECSYDFWTCNKCGMTLNNHLHMFDMRFFVTKRLIDYIYKNLDKKSSLDIANDTGLSIDDVFEIVHVHYREDIKKAYKNNRSSIWFDDNNVLLAS